MRAWACHTKETGQIVAIFQSLYDANSFKLENNSNDIKAKVIISRVDIIKIRPGKDMMLMPEPTTNYVDSRIYDE